MFEDQDTMTEAAAVAFAEAGLMDYQDFDYEDDFAMAA